MRLRLKGAGPVQQCCGLGEKLGTGGSLEMVRADRWAVRWRVTVIVAPMFFLTEVEGKLDRAVDGDGGFESVGGGATAAWSITSGGGSLSSIAQTANPESVSYTPAANYSGTVVLKLTTNAPSACSVVSATRNISIKAKVVISSQPQNVGVCANSQATLSVVAFGDITGYQWYRNGVAVPGATSNILNF